MDVDPVRKILAGFAAVGGSGRELLPGSLCSVTAKRDSVDIGAELGSGRVSLPYVELTSLRSEAARCRAEVGSSVVASDWQVQRKG